MNSNDSSHDIKYFCVVGGSKKQNKELSKNIGGCTKLNELPKKEVPSAIRAESQDVLIVEVLRNRGRIMRIVRRVFSCLLDASVHFDGGEFKNRVVVRSEDIFRNTESVLDNISNVILKSNEKEP